jgi:chaperonin GroES
MGPDYKINQEQLMNIRPLSDRIVVRRLEEATTTPGGIVVPDSAVEKPSQGEVLAVGPGKTLDTGDVRTCDVSAGDKVIFGQYSGSTVSIDDEELLVLSESEIFGVLEN